MPLCFLLTFLHKSLGSLSVRSAQRHMALVDQPSIPILAQDDAGHMICLADIAAYHEILVLMVSDLDPVLCLFAEVIPR